MYQKTTLSNGIRVVTEHIPYVRSVTIGFWFRTGSRDENASNNGISHFIEHMVFKGTGSRSARQIAETIDAAGGQLNAFTSKEHTCYYARVLDQHLELAVEILSDMVLDSNFHTGDIDKEKGVILEEIRMYEDSPDELVHDLFTDAVLAGHPLGKGILGTEETVAAVTRTEMLTYLHDHYTAGNLVVAAAGNVTHDQVVTVVERYMGNHTGAATRLELCNCLPHGHNMVRSKDTEQVHICIGSLGFDRADPLRYALFVLDMALGGGMSSRLFQELREERGLVYAAYSYHTLFQDTGLFTIYAGCSPQNVTQVMQVIRHEFAAVVENGLADDELHRAKEQLKGSLMLSLESTANRMSRLAKAELFHDELLTPDELMACIDAVDSDDVHVVARRLLSPAEQVIACIGPVSAEDLE